MLVFRLREEGASSVGTARCIFLTLFRLNNSINFY